MKSSSKSTWNPKRLDVLAFALAGGQLSGEGTSGQFKRLQDECAPGTGDLEPVSWHVRGEMRASGAGTAQPWLHLEAQGMLAVVCQRCLGPVQVPLSVDRWFRFVADEAAAEAEDEGSEEDVLALEPRPDLESLLEDELLMALPLVPMHEVCPEPVVMSATESDAPQPQDQEPRKNPFAELARLKK